MYDFTFHKAASVADAASKLVTNAALLAGGQTLLPTMKARLARPGTLVDISGLPELHGISVENDQLSIGAAVTHAEVAHSAAVQNAIPALASLAGGIGDTAVRHVGTIGGSVANNDPAADYPAACLALGATIITHSRKIVADDFFTGLFDTALNDGEIITAVRFPIPEKAAYAKFPNPASRYAMVGVMVARSASRTRFFMKHGAEVRVAVTGAGENGVYRASDLEAALSNDWSEAAIDAANISSAGLLSDLHGDAVYRTNLIKVMAKRAVAAS